MKNPYRTSTALPGLNYSYSHPDAFGRAARESVEEAFEAAIAPGYTWDPYERRVPDFEELVGRAGGYLVACGYAIDESREKELREAYLQARRRAAWRVTCGG